LQTLLVENFVSLEPVMKLRLGDVVSDGATPISVPGKAGSHPSPPDNPANGSAQIPAAIAKQIQDIKVVKFVVFPDGSRYELPQAVAVALQIRRECGLG
jgi:hypothetical protein